VMYVMYIYIYIYIYIYMPILPLPPCALTLAPTLPPRQEKLATPMITSLIDVIDWLTRAALRHWLTSLIDWPVLHHIIDWLAMHVIDWMTRAALRHWLTSLIDLVVRPICIHLVFLRTDISGIDHPFFFHLKLKPVLFYLQAFKNKFILSWSALIRTLNPLQFTFCKGIFISTSFRIFVFRFIYFSGADVNMLMLSITRNHSDEITMSNPWRPKVGLCRHVIHITVWHQLIRHCLADIWPTVPTRYRHTTHTCACVYTRVMRNKPV